MIQGIPYLFNCTDVSERPYEETSFIGVIISTTSICGDYWSLQDLGQDHLDVFFVQ